MLDEVHSSERLLRSETKVPVCVLPQRGTRMYQGPQWIMVLVKPIGRFRVTLNRMKMNLQAENIFIWMPGFVRFDEETKGNSEMAFYFTTYVQL